MHLFPIFPHVVFHKNYHDVIFIVYPHLVKLLALAIAIVSILKNKTRQIPPKFGIIFPFFFFLEIFLRRIIPFVVNHFGKMDIFACISAFFDKLCMHGLDAADLYSYNL